jgi:hypothetical protein
MSEALRLAISLQFKIKWNYNSTIRSTTKQCDFFHTKCWGSWHVWGGKLCDSIHYNVQYVMFTVTSITQICKRINNTSILCVRKITFSCIEELLFSPSHPSPKLRIMWPSNSPVETSLMIQLCIRYLSNLSYEPDRAKWQPSWKLLGYKMVDDIKPFLFTMFLKSFLGSMCCSQWLFLTQQMTIGNAMNQKKLKLRI